MVVIAVPIVPVDGWEETNVSGVLISITVLVTFHGCLDVKVDVVQHVHTMVSYSTTCLWQRTLAIKVKRDTAIASILPIMVIVLYVVWVLEMQDVVMYAVDRHLLV
tara:strand:+ start:976 stop:1293 length:318 start_codon:yes stop_codon:yes gene_type:complete